MSLIFEPIIGSEYPKKVIPLFNNAKKNIDIIMYDWRWYANQPGHPVQQFNIALVNAKNRGVHVRAILNTDLLLQTLQKCGIQARLTRDKRTLHTKMILIDGEILVLGSHNLTRNAFGANYESSLIVSIPEDVNRFSEYFNNLYSI